MSSSHNVTAMFKVTSTRFHAAMQTFAVVLSSCLELTVETFRKHLKTHLFKTTFITA